MQPEYPFLSPKYGLQVGAKNTILIAIICVRFFGDQSRWSSGAVPLFVEWCFRGNAGKIKSRIQKNEVKQQADMRPRRRDGTASASSACGRAEGKKVFVQVLSGAALRGTIRGRLLNRGLVRKWAACVADFFQHGAKSCRFSGLALGCVFHARF